jgi:hypothetical protein
VCRKILIGGPVAGPPIFHALSCGLRYAFPVVKQIHAKRSGAGERF